MKFPIKNIQFITAFLALAAIYAACTKGPDIKSYTYPAPEPKAMFPDSGYAGFADVTINGSQFGDYKNAVKVFFNGIPADTILSCEDGKIVARVPANAVSGKVSLQVWTNTIDSIGDFMVVPAPIVSSANKDIGLPGETVEVSGKGFGTDMTNVLVNFNGTTGTIAEITDTLLKVVLPQGFSSGAIVVYVNKYPVIGPLFRAVATLPSPVYWLGFENNLADNMGGTAATFTYSATDGTAQPIAYADGIKGKAVKLSGTGNRATLNNQNSNNQYIACPPQISKYPEITVTAWVNWGRSDTTIWVQEPIFDFGQARGLRMALMTRMGTAAGPNMVGRLIFENINEFTGNVPFDAKASKALTKFKWQHVAMTISTANKIVKVYLDGEMIGSIVLTGTASPTLFNHNKVYIGAPTNGVRNEPAFGGMIDEFQIYNQALNADQVFADYYRYRP
ncbi:MAG TPA: LamG-like jellyroll fold domain-containing protein [Niastella sp.]